MTDPTDSLEAALIEMIVAEITYGQPIEVETDLLLSELVDSLGVVRIVTWLEERLETEIDPTDVVIENFQSVAQMVRYINER